MRYFFCGPFAALALGVAVLAGAGAGCQHQPAGLAISRQAENSIWDRENLVAWSVGPYDARKRDPEERAAMLQRLGFKRYAYYWVPPYIPSFEAEITAMKQRGVVLQGWWAPFEPDDPLLDTILPLLAKHEAQPHLWVIPPLPDFAELAEQSGGALPANFTTLPPAERVRFYPVAAGLMQEMEKRNWPKTPEEHRARVKAEAARVAALAAKAKPFGVTVDLYSHIQWLGVPENQVEVIELLKSQGVENVGIVYNFSHARNAYRDDTRDFARTWRRIQPYVHTVIVAGTHMEDGTALLPGDGDSELEMMRVIQESGWHGLVGVNAETGGDAETTLTKARERLEGLAQQLR